MKSLTKKLLSIFMVLCLTLLSFGLVKVNATNYTFDFSNGTLTDGVATWNNTAMNIIQRKSNSSNNVSASYLAKPRFYQNHIAEFKVNGDFILKSLTFSYDSKDGGTLTFGTGITADGKNLTGTVNATSNVKNKKVSITLGTTESINDLFIKFGAQMRVVSLNYVLDIAEILPSLDKPTATYDSNTKTVNITPVTNAVSYNIGLFNGADLIKEFNTTSTSYVINTKISGEFDVKVQAVGDNVNYAKSDYSDSLGKIIIPIESMTIAEFIALPVDDKVYYQLTGTIVSVEEKYGNTVVVLKDSTGEVKVWGISQSKDVTTQVLVSDLTVGNELTLIGLRSEYSSTPQVGNSYFVSQKSNYLANFVGINTMGSLNVEYNITYKSETGIHEVSDLYDINVKHSNDHKVDATEIVNKTAKISFAKGTATTATRYWKDNNSNKIQLRMYSDSKMTIDFTGVKKIVFNCAKNASNLATSLNGTAKGNDVTVLANENTKTYTIGASITVNSISFVSDQTTIIQVPHYEITKDTIGNKIGLRFGQTISEEIINNIKTQGTTVKFGVVYAKASELGTKTFDAAVADKTAHVEECTPELVGTDYQFAIVLNHIPATSFDDSVTAACYVEIDGVMHLMNAKTYSVNSIALEYVNAHATDENVKEHLEMLKWLSTYKETITK